MGSAGIEGKKARIDMALGGVEGHPRAKVARKFRWRGRPLHCDCGEAGAAGEMMQLSGRAWIAEGGAQ